MLAIGARYGLRAVRVPWEDAARLGAIEARAGHRESWLIAPWIGLLRARIRRHGLTAPDRVFGLAWSGAMTEARIAGLLRHLPEGLTEIYCHPATTAGFEGANRAYRYADELAALTAPGTVQRLRDSGAQHGGFADFESR